MSNDIILQAEGSSIRIRPGSIEITSPGPILVNGAVIKLNC